MAYTPENNPYIPGDPYSYDLKWQVDHINMLQGRVDDLDNAIQEASDQADRSEREADRSKDEADRSKDEADRATQQANTASDYSDYSYRQGLKSEGYAVGQQNGENVDPDSPYYENNSKYYSQKSADSAQSAADYAAHIADPVSGLVTSWLADHITQPTTPAIDTSLLVAGAAADAKAVGDRLFPVINSTNLFNVNGDNETTGYYNRLGTFVTDPTIRSTELIPVTPGNYYLSNITGTSFIVWYTQEQIRMANTDTNEGVAVQAPVNAYYARFIFVAGSENEFYIAGYCSTQQLPLYEKTIDRIKLTANLFNINGNNETTGYYDRTNNLVTNAILRSTEYIPVIPGCSYATNQTGTSYILWYDISKSYITYTDTAPGNVYPAPASAFYARFMFAEQAKNTYIVSAVNNPVAVNNLYRYIYNNMSHFKGLNGVAFGTSLTYRALTTGGYLQYLPALSDTVWDNQGLGSATILTHVGMPDILAAIKNYSAYNDKQICIIEGFCNDWYHNTSTLGSWTDTTETTVCGCLRSAINFIQAQNPSIKIFVVFDNVGQGISASTAVNAAGATQYEYYEEMLKVCEQLAVPVIKGYATSGMNENTPQYFIDNIHPTAAGAEQFARCIWAGMSGYYPNVV